jgi:hypothetical protein
MEPKWFEFNLPSDDDDDDDNDTSDTSDDDDLGLDQTPQLSTPLPAVMLAV